MLEVGRQAALRPDVRHVRQESKWLADLGRDAIGDAVHQAGEVNLRQSMAALKSESSDHLHKGDVHDCHAYDVPQEAGSEH